MAVTDQVLLCHSAGVGFQRDLGVVNQSESLLDGVQDVGNRFRRQQGGGSATKVDGVYDSDPMKNKDAVKYSELTYDQVLDKKLEVMDLTAICLCRDHEMPVRVFEMEKRGALVNIIVGGDEGTLIQ